MDEPLPRIDRHEAFDRFGKAALRTAHDLTAALAEEGRDDPIVVRTDGPHRSIDGLATLIDEALAEDAATGRAVDDDRLTGGTADEAGGQARGS